MSDEQKFVVTEKLINEVVASAADGQLPFDTCANVILDAFKILGSRAIRIGRRAQQDDQNEAQEALNKAKSRFLSNVARKNLIESVIPTMYALKIELEKARSPLLGSLMLCFGAVLREYKNEATDVFASHPRLAAELEFDLRKPLGAVNQSPVNMLKTPAAKMFSARRVAVSPQVIFGSTPGRPQRFTPASARHNITVAACPPPSSGRKKVVSMPREAAGMQSWNVEPTPTKSTPETHDDVEGLGRLAKLISPKVI